ncbi:hypothetical protein HKX48_004046 [Thoreauomyces humboldtii]|nr:hypothetical protein HKX48_004046 [Thoreauomyces humboldtii]
MQTAKHDARPTQREFVIEEDGSPSAFTLKGKADIPAKATTSFSAPNVLITPRSTNTKDTDTADKTDAAPPVPEKVADVLGPVTASSSDKDLPDVKPTTATTTETAETAAGTGNKTKPATVRKKFHPADKAGRYIGMVANRVAGVFSNVSHRASAAAGGGGGGSLGRKKTVVPAAAAERGADETAKETDKTDKTVPSSLEQIVNSSTEAVQDLVTGVKRGYATGSTESPTSTVAAAAEPAGDEGNAKDQAVI